LHASYVKKCEKCLKKCEKCLKKCEKCAVQAKAEKVEKVEKRSRREKGERRRKCGKSEASHKGVKEQVNGLMKACYLAIEGGRYAKAADLARQAHALDGARVEGDPLIFKFHLLDDKDVPCCCPHGCLEPASPECPSCQPSKNYLLPEQPKQDEEENLSLRPALPEVDPGMVAALDDIYSDVLVQVQEAPTGSLQFGVGVNSDAGLTGSLVLNERNFDCFVKATPKADCDKGGEEATSHSFALPLLSLDDCSVTLLDMGRVVSQACLGPVMPKESDKGSLSLGLSLTGKIDAYLRAPHDGVVYNLMLKDGVVIVWMTAAQSAE
jgi:hypothetical protein